MCHSAEPYRAQYFKVRGPIWSGPGAAFPNLASFGRNICRAELHLPALVVLETLAVRSTCSFSTACGIPGENPSGSRKMRWVDGVKSIHIVLRMVRSVHSSPPMHPNERHSAQNRLHVVHLTQGRPSRGGKEVDRARHCGCWGRGPAIVISEVFLVWHL